MVHQVVHVGVERLLVDRLAGAVAVGVVPARDADHRGAGEPEAEHLRGLDRLVEHRVAEVVEPGFEPPPFELHRALEVRHQAVRPHAPEPGLARREVGLFHKVV